MLSPAALIVPTPAPATGRTVVALDYIEEALRPLPTEVRIIRDTGRHVADPADATYPAFTRTAAGIDTRVRHLLRQPAQLEAVLQQSKLSIQRQTLTRLTQYESLTGLPNRRKLPGGARGHHRVL